MKKEECVLRLFVSALVLSVVTSAHGNDPILEWVNSSLKTQQSFKSSAWNPGLLPFDETQIRIDMDNLDDFERRWHSNEQSIRMAIKPLSGLSNEFRLSKQRKKILDLEINNFKAQKMLGAYNQVLYIWKIKKAVRVLDASSKLFNKAKKNLKTLKRSQNINFDLTEFLSNIANFSNLKMKFSVNDRGISKFLKAPSEKANKFLKSVDKISFLSFESISKTLGSLSSGELPLTLEMEQKKLKFYELEKKKHEAYQIFKFISVSRAERINRVEDYKFQLAFRIPFLSDSQELAKANVDYILENGKLEQNKVKKTRKLQELKSEILGLIEKANILKLLPRKSLNSQKMASSLSSVSSAVNSESNFIKVKFDQIETQSLVYEKYLLYLALNDKLSSRDTNYLITKP